MASRSFPSTIGVMSMPDIRYCKHIQSLTERKKAIEEKLDWIDFQRSMVKENYTRNLQWLDRQKEQVLGEMREIIRLQKKERIE